MRNSSSNEHLKRSEMDPLSDEYLLVMNMRSRGFAFLFIRFGFLTCFDHFQFAHVLFGKYWKYYLLDHLEFKSGISLVSFAINSSTCSNMF